MAFHIRLRNGVTDRYAKIETEYLLPNQTHYFFSKAFEVYFFLLSLKFSINSLNLDHNFGRRWDPTPALLPEKSHGWRSLEGCSPWVAKSRTRLSDLTFTFPFHALEKEMATHSSVLAWRIPGTGEPGELPSMGSHRVGHD